ncbi:MAG: hypothetical protein KCHDKBKB_02291 [Elusimicrobia bacterium]|nr:hypothetical protein [Elusimicrobiota bacterium]
MAENVFLLHATETNFWTARQKVVKSLQQEEPVSPQDSPSSKSPQMLLASLPKADLGHVLPYSLKALSDMGIKNDLAPDLKATLANRVIPPWMTEAIAPTAMIHEVALSKNPKAKTLLLMQDAHNHFEAQTNIAATVDAVARALEKRGSSLLVGMEGADVPAVDFSPYNKIIYRKTLHDVAKAMLKVNIYNGVEFAAIGYVGDGKNGEVKLPLTVTGVENKDEYWANVKALRQAAPLKPKAKKALALFKRTLTEMKANHYKSDMQMFDQKWQGYQEGTVTVPDYALYLDSIVPMFTPNLKQLLDAALLQNSINFDRVERERKKILEGLVSKISKEETNRLLEYSALFQAGQISSTGYYDHLRKVCGKHGIAFSQYPEMALYVEYVLKSESIDGYQLLKDMESLEAAVIEKLAATPEEKQVASLAKDYSLLEKLAQHIMTEDEWHHYESRLGEIKNFEKRFGAVGVPFPKEMKKFNGWREIFEAFYHSAIARNHTMSTHMAARLSDAPTQTALLVVGGFHTQGLLQELKQHDLNILTLSPKITQVDEGTLSSIDFLESGRMPLDRLFAGERLFVPVGAVTAGMQGPGAANTAFQLADRVTAKLEGNLPVERPNKPKKGNTLGFVMGAAVVVSPLLITLALAGPLAVTGGILVTLGLLTVFGLFTFPRLVKRIKSEPVPSVSQSIAPIPGAESPKSPMVVEPPSVSQVEIPRAALDALDILVTDLEGLLTQAINLSGQDLYIQQEKKPNSMKKTFVKAFRGIEDVIVEEPTELMGALAPIRELKGTIQNQLRSPRAVLPAEMDSLLRNIAAKAAEIEEGLRKAYPDLETLNNSSERNFASSNQPQMSEAPGAPGGAGGGGANLSAVPTKPNTSTPDPVKTGPMDTSPLMAKNAGLRDRMLELVDHLENLRSYLYTNGKTIDSDFNLALIELAGAANPDQTNYDRLNALKRMETILLRNRPTDSNTSENVHSVRTLDKIKDLADKVHSILLNALKRMETILSRNRSTDLNISEGVPSARILDRKKELADEVRSILKGFEEIYPPMEESLETAETPQFSQMPLFVQQAYNDAKKAYEEAQAKVEELDRPQSWSIEEKTLVGLIALGGVATVALAVQFSLGFSFPPLLGVGIFLVWLVQLRRGSTGQEELSAAQKELEEKRQDFWAWNKYQWAFNQSKILGSVIPSPSSRIHALFAQANARVERAKVLVAHFEEQVTSPLVIRMILGGELIFGVLTVVMAVVAPSVLVLLPMSALLFFVGWFFIIQRDTKTPSNLKKARTLLFQAETVQTRLRRQVFPFLEGGATSNNNRNGKTSSLSTEPPIISSPRKANSVPSAAPIMDGLTGWKSVDILTAFLRVILLRDLQLNQLIGTLSELNQSIRDTDLTTALAGLTDQQQGLENSLPNLTLIAALLAPVFQLNTPVFEAIVTLYNTNVKSTKRDLELSRENADESGQLWLAAKQLEDLFVRGDGSLFPIESLKIQALSDDAGINDSNERVKPFVRSDSKQNQMDILFSVQAVQQERENLMDLLQEQNNQLSSEDAERLADMIIVSHEILSGFGVDDELLAKSFLADANRLRTNLFEQTGSDRGRLPAELFTVAGVRTLFSEILLEHRTGASAKKNASEGSVTPSPNWAQVQSAENPIGQVQRAALVAETRKNVLNEAVQHIAPNNQGRVVILNWDGVSVNTLEGQVPEASRKEAAQWTPSRVQKQRALQSAVRRKSVTRQGLLSAELDVSVREGTVGKFFMCDINDMGAALALTLEKLKIQQKEGTPVPAVGVPASQKQMQSLVERLRGEIQFAESAAKRIAIMKRLDLIEGAMQINQLLFADANVEIALNQTTGRFDATPVLVSLLSQARITNPNIQEIQIISDRMLFDLDSLHDTSLLQMFDVQKILFTLTVPIRTQTMEQRISEEIYSYTFA